jgi:FlaA1/EpsC-like NDP-sugar epimerase
MSEKLTKATIMIEKYPKFILLIRRKLFDVFSRYSVPRWMVFFTDNLAVFLVFLLAYLLRFNFDVSAFNPAVALNHGLVVLLVYAIFSIIFRSYSGLLRRTTLTDISLVFLVTLLSTTSLLLITAFRRTIGVDLIPDIPLSIILIHYVTITVVLFFVRISVKLIFRFATSPIRNTRNVLIYGAGELGFVVKGIILSDPKSGFNVRGFVDNDRNLQGKKINGIPVFGEVVLSKDFLTKNSIESLILADKDLSIEEKSRVIRAAISLGIEVLETPDIDKWLAGQVNTHHFERVKLEDLLGREPIKLNMALIKDALHGKTIMITGAAGSIGSEIVRQLARFNTRKVILVDQAETPLFYLENELNSKFGDLKFQVQIADVTNYELMDQIFRDHLPDIVFHAAAYKHVSLMEENPHEAIRVNVGGTRVVTELAQRYRVDKFVMISTDKSVNPTSVMGTSKRICEQIVQSRSQSGGGKTQFIITRFGNVLGSNGSVIPLFSEQIQRGGPVTVTHPEVYRYFMTIPEACQLVLEAGIMGKGGEIFVFDMGEPVKIADLATNMILLSGYVPGKDIQIVYTGLRPGEKLFEELLTDKEATLPTHHQKIKIARVEKLNGAVVLTKIEALLRNLYQLTRQDIINIMKELVPEYNCSNAKYRIGGERRVERVDPPAVKLRLTKELIEKR